MALFGITSIAQDQPEAIIIGDLSSKNTFVYLCGLTPEWDAPVELERRAAMDAVGKQVGARFIEVRPIHRALDMDNMLYWPCYDPEMLDKTDKEIQDVVQKFSAGQPILGYVGFSNGGAFVSELAQKRSITGPLVSIASVGAFMGTSVKNKLYVLIGRQDANYGRVNEFVQEVKETQLEVEKIEFDGGHIIPQDLLAIVLTQALSGPSAT